MIKKALLYMIKGYQNYISPKWGPHCRYTPTCSRYAYEAIQRFGALRGFLLAAWRVLRCNPFSMGGYDPVPREFSLKRNRKERKCHAG